MDPVGNRLSLRGRLASLGLLADQFANPQNDSHRCTQYCCPFRADESTNFGLSWIDQRQ